MTSYAIEPHEIPTVEVAGREERFPVRRIYCVGRNYASHAWEMGKDPNREPPFFFTKPPDAVVANGVDVPYPPQTENLHHEIELVAAIGKTAKDVSEEKALEHVFGYAAGNDLTRRDLQLAAREKGRPWDTGKAFDMSAPISALQPAETIGHPAKGRIWLAVNGETRQDGDLEELIWDVPEIVSILSGLFTLKPGDLIYTGTPKGVDALARGDVITGGIEGVGELSTKIV